MSLKVFYDADLDLEPLRRQQVAIIGYGAQGRAHALNLRDSGISVTVGQREGPSFEAAIADGFQPKPVSSVASPADLIALMLPDESHQQVFEDEIKDNLQPGNSVLCCHGFSFLYEQVKPPAGVASLLVAPKGAGHRVRSAYEEGSGVPCYVAVGQEEDGPSWDTALAYAKALGGGRVGVMKATISEETETDLFGEQAVLCGGVNHLAAAAFETLVEAGYPEEMAYFECVHELKLVVDLLYAGGIKHMRRHISNTAEYGDYSRGPRIVSESVRRTLREILAEIQSGEFAREWIAAAHSSRFERMRSDQADSSLVRAGERVQRLIRGEELRP